MRFAGVVLTGGASSRMGTDKAFIEIDGRALALRVADALVGAGADPILAIGGDLDRLRTLGLDARPDRASDLGPLAGIVTALEQTDAEVVVVAACDLVSITAVAVSELLDALTDDADAVIPRSDRLEPLMAAYRRRCLDHLRNELDEGERAPHRAVEGLAVVQVRLQHDEALRDADNPGDLPIA
jgi:molybdopterin-guanine dinucleotide biosynthesis protein A